jgi:hypothetical protein
MNISDAKPPRSSRRSSSRGWKQIATGRPVQFGCVSHGRCSIAEVGRSRKVQAEFVTRVTNKSFQKCFLFVRHKSDWRTSCNIWRTNPLTIEVKSH